MPVISVIVPIFNSSKTIARCLDSVMKQTLTDIEIMCIDDCSDDDSVSIVKKLMENDGRIVLIKHDRNHGTLKTRYDGVMNSTGRYVMLVDSDDEIVPNGCEELSKMMDSSDADMIQFGTEIVSEHPYSGRVRWYNSFLKTEPRNILGDKVFEEQMKNLPWHVWNRIYRADLCKKGYSDAGERYLNYSDDLFVSFFITYYCRHLRCTEKKYYKYHIDEGLTGNADDLKLLKTICDNSWFVKECELFLRKEGKWDTYGRYCHVSPLSEYEHCKQMIHQLSKEEDITKAKELMISAWDYEPYCGNLRNSMSFRTGPIARKYYSITDTIKTNRIRRGIKSLWVYLSSIIISRIR